jgi:hypothetical protein
VLAPAAPGVGTAASRLDDADLVEFDPDEVGRRLAAFDLGLEHVAASDQGDDRAAPQVVLAAEEDVGAGVLADDGLGQPGQCHGGPPVGVAAASGSVYRAARRAGVVRSGLVGREDARQDRTHELAGKAVHVDLVPEAAVQEAALAAAADFLEPGLLVGAGRRG